MRTRSDSEPRPFVVVIEIGDEEFMFNVEALTTADAHHFAEIAAWWQGLNTDGAKVTVYKGG